ncbi:hypothetical protein P1P75_15275 [Streptomyces sp. ID05-39B]|uniref:hypothetical protein n=1 Tax=Streptomyces sp. ID05-39B TaxID=3028664 RepID=UPI0029B23E24|nr:hypothetical protein [Streptomyces sp. ID05-39B]MDX3527765.1 hypothetical protein [Streptomyces sp. ID05-39B]
MTSLSAFQTIGGENGRFANAFISLHDGNVDKAERCWDLQVSEILNDLDTTSDVPYWDRPAWAEEKAKWKLWFYAVFNQCAAP